MKVYENRLSVIFISLIRQSGCYKYVKLGSSIYNGYLVWRKCNRDGRIGSEVENILLDCPFRFISANSSLRISNMGDETFQASGDAIRRGLSAGVDWLRKHLSGGSQDFDIKHNPSRNLESLASAGVFSPDLEKWKKIREQINQDPRRSVEMHEHQLSSSKTFDPLSRRGSSASEVEEEVRLLQR